MKIYSECINYWDPCIVDHMHNVHGKQDLKKSSDKIFLLYFYYIIKHFESPGNFIQCEFIYICI